MPEGHSIRRLANQWSELEGEQLQLSSPQGRFAVEASLLAGSRFLKADAHGKHLFLEFEHGQIIHIHLGLYGKFRWYPSEVAPSQSTTVRLRALHSNGHVDLSGPTRCQLITPQEKAAVDARLGPDPLRPKDTVKPLQSWAKSIKAPIAQTLMNQRRIAGIGNVYRAEILFLLGLNPYGATSALSGEAWSELWELSRTLLRSGVKHSGGITTTLPTLPKPAALPPGTACATSTYVYKRTGLPCLVCGTPIRQEELAGRALYWCPTCQVG